MAKDDYCFPDEAAFLAWVRTRPPAERWHYVGGYAVLSDGLWDGEHWHAPPPARAGMRERIARAILARRRPDFSTTEKFLDWSNRRKDDP